jgi:hypothetical protein
MSNEEYGRLVTEIAQDVGIIKGLLLTYPDNVKMLTKHDTDIESIKQKCNGVQEAKKNAKVPLGNLKGSIISGLIVGVIMMIINAIEWFAR